MNQAVISGTGLYTPPYAISNEELIDCFNAYVGKFNADNAAAIASGAVTALEESSAGFIEKGSGIKSRFVMEKEGILDVQRMVPRIPDRPDTAQSLTCELAVAAAQQRLSHPARTAADGGVVL